MTHIDLYAIHGLDRREMPETLAAQLTARLNSTAPSDTVTRYRLDVARAILGDPARRARYDAALADPTAPTIDERALATIAGRPAPAAPRTGLATAFATTRARIMTAVVGALALLLVISVTAIACSSDGGSTPSASNGTDSSSDQSSSGDGESCKSVRGRAVWRAEWKKEKRPHYVLKLDKAIDLPAPVAAEVDDPNPSVNQVGQLTQFQDRSIGVGVIGGSIFDEAHKKYQAQYSQAGELLKVYAVYDGSPSPPKPFDQVEDVSTGYMTVETTDGIQVPAEAGGTESGQQYVTNALPDAFDKDVVWVLMRGGTKLYRGTVYYTADGSTCDPN